MILNVSTPETSELLLAQPYIVIPYITILALAAVTGTFGNILVMGTMILMPHSKDHEAENIFIFNLAISDTTVTAFINPFSIIGKSVLNNIISEAQVL